MALSLILISKINNYITDELVETEAEAEDSSEPKLFLASNWAGKHIYRQHALGKSLEKTLATAVEQGILPKFRSIRVLEVFDCIMDRLLRRPAHLRMAFKAEKLLSYQYNEGMWTFWAKNVTFRVKDHLAHSPLMKIQCTAADIFDHFHEHAPDLEMDEEFPLPENVGTEID